jgi:hypothetical protein
VRESEEGGQFLHPTALSRSLLPEIVCENDDVPSRSIELPQSGIVGHRRTGKTSC